MDTVTTENPNQEIGISTFRSAWRYSIIPFNWPDPRGQCPTHLHHSVTLSFSRISDPLNPSHRVTSANIWRIFSHLSLRLYSFGHYPKFRAVVSREDLISWLTNSFALCLSYFIWYRSPYCKTCNQLMVDPTSPFTVGWKKECKIHLLLDLREFIPI